MRVCCNSMVPGVLVYYGYIAKGFWWHADVYVDVELNRHSMLCSAADRESTSHTI